MWLKLELKRPFYFFVLQQVNTEKIDDQRWHFEISGRMLLHFKDGKFWWLLPRCIELFTSTEGKGSIKKGKSMVFCHTPLGYGERPYFLAKVFQYLCVKMSNHWVTLGPLLMLMGLGLEGFWCDFLLLTTVILIRKDDILIWVILKTWRFHKNADAF